MVAEAEKAFAKTKEASEKALLAENEDLKKQIQDLQLEISKMRSAQGQEQQTADEQRKRLRYLGEYQYQSDTAMKSLSLQRGFARADYMFAIEENDVATAAIASGQLQTIDSIAAELHRARRYEEVDGKSLWIPETVYTATPVETYVLEESDEHMMDGRDDSLTWSHLDSKTILYVRKRWPISSVLPFDAPCKSRPCRDHGCNHGAPPTLKSVLAQKPALPAQVPSTSSIAGNPSNTMPPRAIPNLPAALPPPPMTAALLAPPLQPTNLLPIVMQNPPTTLTLAPVTAATLVPAATIQAPIVSQPTAGGANPSTTAALPAMIRVQPKAWYKRSPPRWVSLGLTLLGFFLVVAGVMMELPNFNTSSVAPHAAQNTLISLNDTCAFVPPTITAVSCGIEPPTAIATTPTPIETEIFTGIDSGISPEASGGDHVPFEGDEVWEDGPVSLNTFSTEILADTIVLVTAVVVPVSIMVCACGW
ncbi:hypothetical protein BKA64DRAFT_701481 [Cadophora sp. MPI-SDFR-AT-0126]|nr:hypothetical protein BKA64DRAFT_701481 [Leotiomycetes sp. MPI-SDFR-AT-0126]